MTGTDLPQTPPPLSEDELRLRDFLAAAAPLVAVERGLTAVCRNKLAAIAGDLKMSDAELQAAMVRLQKGDDEPAAPPLVEAWTSGKFRDYLSKKLRKLSAPVLTPDQQDRLVAIAAKRYTLTEPSARRLIEEASSGLSIQLIERSAAERHVASWIAKIADDAVRLDQPLWEKIWQGARSWGLADEQVRQLVDEHLARNRELHRSERRRRTMVQGAAIFGLIFVCVMGILLFLNRGTDRPVAEASPSNSPASPSLPGIDEKATTATDKPQQPAWWDVEITVLLTELKRKHANFAPIFTELAADSVARRSVGYERLVNWITNRAKIDEDRAPLANLLARLHALEPYDSAAARLRDRLLSFALMARRELRNRELDYHLAYWSVEVAAAGLSHKSISPARANSLADLLERTLEIAIPRQPFPDDVQRRCFAALSELLYRQLISSAVSSPELVLHFQPVVAKFARGCLPAAELEKLNANFVLSALQAARENWPEYRELIETAIASSDLATIARFVDLYERIQLQGLQKYLGDLLELRAGLDLTPSDPKIVASKIREALGIRTSTSVAGTQGRPQQVRTLAQEFLGQPRAKGSDIRAMLHEMVRAANLANAMIAAGQANTSQEKIEQLLENLEGTLPLLKERSAKIEYARAAAKLSEKNSVLAEGKRKQVEQQISVLANFELAVPVKRYVALKTLAKLLPEVGTLSSNDGAVVAKYLLSAKPAEEKKQLEETIPIVSRDLQVRLGLADSLANATGKQDGWDSLFSGILGRAITREELRPPFAAVRRALLADVRAELPESEWDNRGRDLPAMIDVAQSSLEESYRTRAELWGMEWRSGSEQPGTADLLAALSRHLFNDLQKGTLSARDKKYLESLPHQLIALDYLGGNDLRRSILLQRVLLRLMSVTSGTGDSAPTSDWADLYRGLSAADASYHLFFEQLRDGEVDLLRLLVVTSAEPGGRE